MEPEIDILEYLQNVQIVKEEQMAPADHPPLKVLLTRKDNGYDVCLLYQESEPTLDSQTLHFLRVLTVQDPDIIYYFDQYVEMDAEEGCISIYKPSAEDSGILELQERYGYDEYEDGIYSISHWYDSESDDKKQLLKLPKGGK